MAQILTPPASRQTSEVREIEETQEVDSSELLHTLDTLLERYLHLLDQHQKFQADLGKQLSSGFLSLAQANYTCPPGRRYGADYYDERMKATRRVSLQRLQWDVDGEREGKAPEHLSYTFAIEPAAKRPDEALENKPTDAERSSDGNTDSGEADSSNLSEHTESKSDSTTQKPKPVKKFRSLDPITWYGILVPPSLRSVQKSFAVAVNGQLPGLASVVVEMRDVEREVDNVRRRLGHATMR